MHFQIRSEPLGALKTLESLPNAKLAVLEGLNGIGKTLTVRLLQICTGTMPYRTDSPAWKSLREGLGEFRVLASDLHGASQVEWVADSREWLVDPGLGIAAATFRSIRIDGRDADLEEVRRLLLVDRVGGDEGLVETLAEQANSEGAVVRAWAARYTDPDHGPLASLETLAAEVQSGLTQWTPKRLQEKRWNVTTIERELKTIREEAKEVALRRAQLKEAAAVQGELRDIVARAPGIEERLTEVNREIGELQASRHKADSEIKRIAGQAAMEGAAQSELTNATNTLERNRRKLQDELNSFTILGTGFGMSDPSDPQLPELLQRLTIDVDQLIERQTQLDAAPAMRTLLDSVSSELRNADRRGLADQVAFEDTDFPAVLTVGELRSGIATRRASLEGHPVPPEAEDLSRELAKARQARTKAQVLSERAQGVERLERLVATNEERVAAALRAAGGGAATKLSELDERRRDFDERLQALAAEGASLQAQVAQSDGESRRKALEAQLASIVTTIGISDTQIDSELGSNESEWDEFQQRVGALESRRGELNKELERLHAEIALTTERLSSPSLSWLMDATPWRIAGVPTTLEDQLGQHLRLRETLGEVLERLGRFRVQVAALGTALESIADDLRGRPAPATEYVPELRGWLEERFALWFNMPRVKDQLFPEAKHDVPVLVDLEEQRVTWEDSKGRQSKPLEAFSSGEQAFAYTRARIAAYDDPSSAPSNRLIVLDEFGAFIAHDRLDSLLGYLKERSTAHPSEQILVILPLSRDYQELADNSLGDMASKYRELAASIESRKYAVEVLG